MHASQRGWVLLNVDVLPRSRWLLLYPVPCIPPQGASLLPQVSILLQQVQEAVDTRTGRDTTCLSLCCPAPAIPDGKNHYARDVM